MNQPVVLTFYDYKTHPRPEQEHFLSTVTLDHLVDELCDHYRKLRPDLPGMFDQKPVESVRLDVHGPIYGSGDVTVTAPSGYQVACPVSHADVVADYLRELAERPSEPGAPPFVIFRCMHHLAAIPRSDVLPLVEAFSKGAEAAVVQRTVVRATCFSVDVKNPAD